MARGAFGKRGVKTRKASVGLEGDNAPPLGTRKPISVMNEPGQDAEASDYPAKKSRKGVSRGERSRAGGSGSVGIMTKGKGNG